MFKKDKRGAFNKFLSAMNVLRLSDIKNEAAVTLLINQCRGNLSLCKVNERDY
jgi:hypothetical protein